MISLHLPEISACVAPSRHTVPIMYGAVWRQASDKLLRVENITMMYFLLFSPKLHRFENILSSLRDQ